MCYYVIKYERNKYDYKPLTRQTNFGTIYTGPLNNPVFKDIYAPLDGFVVNAGIKIKL